MQFADHLVNSRGFRAALRTEEQAREERARKLSEAAKIAARIAVRKEKQKARALAAKQKHKEEKAARREKKRARKAAKKEAKKKARISNYTSQNVKYDSFISEALNFSQNSHNVSCY